MFRSYLTSPTDHRSLSLQWIQRLGGLVRVPLFDSTNEENAFVVVYTEQTRRYSAVSFRMNDGEIEWQKEVVNGGYGSPAIFDDQMLLLSNFTDVTSLDKSSGAVKWEFTTKSRIRSSLNVVQNEILFSSGANIFALSAGGKIKRHVTHPEAFFFGIVDRYEDYLYSLGTHEDEHGVSHVWLFCFDITGRLVYKVDLGQSGIASSDSSGICWSTDMAVIGLPNQVAAIRRENGEIIWKTNVNGNALRQVCTTDTTRVFYTTQEGKLGALEMQTGRPLWDVNFTEKPVVTPASIIGNRVAVCADGYLYIFDSENGFLIDRIATGHSPYSALAIHREHALLGGGEPPHHGLLFCFRLHSHAHKDDFICIPEYQNNFIESKFVNVVIKIFNATEEIERVDVDVSVVSDQNRLSSHRQDNHHYFFSVRPSQTIASGQYVLPVFVQTKHRTVTRTILLSLDRLNKLPARAVINHLSNITQELPNYSGAAIAKIVGDYYGNEDISQRNIREMVDYVAQKAGYEPFQVWRIILRRVLSSKAKCVEDLPEYQPGNSH